MKNNVNSLIIEEIRNSEEISTIELASKLNIERHTLVKYLEILRSKGLIDYKEFGRTKVWFESKSPLISLFESNDEISVQVKNLIGSLDEDVNILDKNMNIIWTSNAKNIENKTCHKVFNNSDEICDECPALITLEDGKENKSSLINKNSNFEIKTMPIKSSQGEVVGIIEKIKKL
ncbi:hypothetical protein CL617_01125 [archaeon]|nr:hypothetical protein [archaeon]|tara:strand:- start:11177 stop:11704 length:528 start_codon:yes stop_codon:yes gene_type:complete